MAKRVDIAEEDYLSGLNEVITNLQAAVDNIKAKGGRGAVEAGIHILGKSAERAPVKEGDLRGSGYVSVNDSESKVAESECDEVSKAVTIKINPDNAPDDVQVVEIGFSGPYAAYQHEHTEFEHPMDGEAKFLEKTLIEEKDAVLGLIADAVTGGD